MVGTNQGSSISFSPTVWTPWYDEKTMFLIRGAIRTTKDPSGVVVVVVGRGKRAEGRGGGGGSEGTDRCVIRLTVIGFAVARLVGNRGCVLGLVLVLVFFFFIVFFIVSGFRKIIIFCMYVSFF
jgi:hypothetical protein